MHHLLGSDRFRQVRFDHVAAIQAGGFRPGLFVGDELQRFSRALHLQPCGGFQLCDFGPHLLLGRAHFGLGMLGEILVALLEQCGHAGLFAGPRGGDFLARTGLRRST